MVTSLSPRFGYGSYIEYRYPTIPRLTVRHAKPLIM